MEKEKFTKWLPFKVMSYRADTGHLSLEQHGAYVLFLGEQWVSGGIPNDNKAIKRILMGKRRTDPVQEVLDDFFVLEEDGMWRNEHLKVVRDEQQAKYTNKVEKGREAVKRRGSYSKPTLVNETEKVTEYGFRGEVIRLKNADFMQWKELYKDIDIVQELKRIDIELRHNKDNSKWFVTVSHKLNYANKLAVKGKLPSKPQFKGAI